MRRPQYLTPSFHKDVDKWEKWKKTAPAEDLRNARIQSDFRSKFRSRIQVIG